MSEFAIDGIAPTKTLEPIDEAEARHMVLGAQQITNTLVPVGAGISLHTGNLLKSEGLAALSSAKLNSIVEFAPDDMVVTAGAGVTLNQLQETLHSHGQFVPLNSPFGEKATLGGIVATNAQGFWRPAFGAPRDRLLGLRVVLPNGDIVKAGGKVVKNVAGYDLCKLFAGSWGTLGFITEVTFKTSPLPACTLSRTYLASAVDALNGALAVYSQRLDPVALSVLGTKDNATIFVQCTGSEEAATWQSQAIEEILLSHHAIPISQTISDEALSRYSEPSYEEVRIRISSRPNELPALIEHIGPLASRWNAIVPNGILEAVFSGDSITRADITTLLRGAGCSDTNVMWLDIPSTWKDDFDVWPVRMGEFQIMQCIKKAIDPHGLFSPGRFSGRL